MRQTQPSPGRLRRAVRRVTAGSEGPKDPLRSMSVAVVRSTASSSKTLSVTTPSPSATDAGRPRESYETVRETMPPRDSEATRPSRSAVDCEVSAVVVQPVAEGVMAVAVVTSDPTRTPSAAWGTMARETVTAVPRLPTRSRGEPSFQEEAHSSGTCWPRPGSGPRRCDSVPSAASAVALPAAASAARSAPPCQAVSSWRTVVRVAPAASL